MKQIIAAILVVAGLAFFGYRCYPKRNKECTESGYTIPSLTAEQREVLIGIADKTDLSLQDQKAWKEFWDKMIVPVKKEQLWIIRR